MTVCVLVGELERTDHAHREVVATVLRRGARRCVPLDDVSSESARDDAALPRVNWDGDAPKATLAKLSDR